MTVVKYVFPISHRFRAPFHEQLRVLLARHDIRYEVVYSPPFGINLLKQDTVDIPWGKKVPILSSFPGRAIYQCALREVIKSDLVIVQQESRLLLNYPVQIMGRLGIVRVAFFGHGKNWKATNPNAVTERFKRFLATKVNWWFAYTDDVADYVASIGFPKVRITTFNNAIDTSHLRSLLGSVSQPQSEAFRADLGIPSGAPLGLFIGGMYPLKRLRFLIEAAVKVHAAMPDFHLIIAGDGPDRHLAEAAAADHAWVHYLGTVFDEKKAIALRNADVFLMPGLVGLAVLDAFTAAMPVLTTNLPYHSPEIAYLKDGHTGYILDDPEDTAAYARATVALLSDKKKLSELSANAHLAAKEFSIENMAQHFVDGILGALGRT